MQLKPPADELAEIRTEIARLRAREGELRALLLHDAAMPKIGRFHKVDLVTNRQRVFDPRLLPEEIRLDPAYTREKVTRVLRATRKGPSTQTETVELPAPAPRIALRARLFAGQHPH